MTMLKKTLGIEDAYRASPAQSPNAGPEVATLNLITGAVENQFQEEL